MATIPVLYSFLHSSCSRRVRYALAIKGIEYEQKTLNLNKNQHHNEDYRQLNAQGFVPVLEVNGHVISQSLSIIEYLDEVYPEKPLLPKDCPIKRADVRSLSSMIAADIQPVQNLSVLRKVAEFTDELAWGKWVVEKGFKTLEKSLESTHGRYCFGDDVTMVDLCLVPQVYNAKRFKVDLDQFPIINKLFHELLKVPAFAAEHSK